MNIFGSLNKRSLIDKQNRPVIKFSLDRLELFCEVLALGGLLAMAFLLFNSYNLLPDTIPTHFGPAGQADDWGSRSSIFLCPAIGLAIFVMFSLLVRFPHTFNYMVAITEANARIQYKMGRMMMFVLKTVIIWMFFYITYASIKVAFGVYQGLNPLMTVLFLVMIFGIIGIYMYLSFKNR